MPPLRDPLPYLKANYLVNPDTGCWIWARSVDWSGYGSLSINGRSQRAHRMAWQLLVGDIPEGMFVLHKCNVPRCINPDHLYLGSRADNWADFKATGRNIIRNTSGEHNGRVKLTEANVLEIRRRRQAGENWKVLAKEYGVSHKTIWKVSTKNSWRHI